MHIIPLTFSTQDNSSDTVKLHELTTHPLLLLANHLASNNAKLNYHKKEYPNNKQNKNSLIAMEMTQLASGQKT